MQNVMNKPRWHAGIARTKITPPAGIELAGLGYYLNRVWQRVRNDLAATALVITDESGRSVVLLALDLMYNSTELTTTIRQQVAAATHISPQHICVNVSHTHNAPTARFIRGCGEVNESYARLVAEQASTAAITAWRKRESTSIHVGSSNLIGMTFNRTRENGPVDSRVSVLRIDSQSGRPLAIAVNFHSHCTAYMETDLFAIGRDWPGDVVDQLEMAFPGATAMYLQGVCGDVNFLRKFNGTELRHEPGRAVTRAALGALNNARPIENPTVSGITRQAVLPTRRWTDDEIMRDREEGLYRLRTGDATDWLDGFARVIVNQPERLPLRYGGSVERAVAAMSRFAVEWTDAALPDFETRPESLPAEVQALRIGNCYMAACPAELFTSLGLRLRKDFPEDNLFILGYSNGSIGYMPDAHDVERQSYAAIQSPKFTDQFPFTARSGTVLVDTMLEALQQTRIT